MTSVSGESASSATPSSVASSPAAPPCTPRKSTGTIALPDAVAIHGKELCSLAKRVPRSTNGIDADDTEDNKAQQFALVQMIQFFDANPKWCSNIWSHIQHKAYGGPSSAKKLVATPDAPTWDPAYRNIYRIPKNWIAKFLTTAFPEQFNSQMVNNIDEKDPQALYAGFYFITNFQEKSALPSECLVKALL